VIELHDKAAQERHTHDAIHIRCLLGELPDDDAVRRKLNAADDHGRLGAAVPGSRRIAVGSRKTRSNAQARSNGFGGIKCDERAEPSVGIAPELMPANCDWHEEVLCGRVELRSYDDWWRRLPPGDDRAREERQHHHHTA
jgi:hypothetical protein